MRGRMTVVTQGQSEPSAAAAGETTRVCVDMMRI
jgi:hypothetical protein